MDADFALADARARVAGVNLDGSPRRAARAINPLYDGPRMDNPALQHRPAQPSVLQEWVQGLPFMQQTVLLAAIRGPDGARKFHPSKPLLRWYRRCVLISAFEHKAILDPFTPGGGSFTGPIFDAKVAKDPILQLEGFRRNWEHFAVSAVDAFLEARDELPHHFQIHAMHAFQIVGYKHSDDRIRAFWHAVYNRVVEAMHLLPETPAQMDKRLSDDRDAWEARADVNETRGCTVTCSD